MRSCGYPVIDLFAGPGGLGEGFTSYRDQKGHQAFIDSISIERDERAHSTLFLRHFLRAFGERGFPEDYYQFLSGELSLDELYERHPSEHKHASDTALRISLSVEEHERVKTLIRTSLGNTKKWVLIGGPPCQAYSLVGRSRMKGRADFQQDERHFLYREYLRIIADHAPPIFVMENVKGLISSKINGELVISKILQDLSDPGLAIHQQAGLKYRLYSLSNSGELQLSDDPAQFLVKAEQYGVPQARHRMFIVGIRSDIPLVPQQLTKTDAPTVSEMIGNLTPIRSQLSKNDSFDEWVKNLKAFDLHKLRSLGELKCSHRSLVEVISTIRERPELLPRVTASASYPSQSSSTNRVLNCLYDPRIHHLTGHDARSHMSSDHHRYLYSAAFAVIENQSPKLADFPEFLLPNHKNTELGCAGKMFSDRFRVQIGSRVATTITSHISKDGHYFIHYDPRQCRSLTVREAARLQTFPDNYHFLGPRTSQYHQIGNAVPPFLSVQIAELVAEILDAAGD